MVKRLRKTFYGLPFVSIEDITKGTIALIGSKVVTESIHRPYGVEKAAEVLREVSEEYVGYMTESYDVLHERDVVDLGDFSAEELGDVVREVINRGGIAIVIGGDHATTYYSLRKVALESILWLDAHLDLASEEDYAGSVEINHANALMRLAKLHNGLRVTVAGFRGFSTPKIELERARELGVNIIMGTEEVNKIHNIMETVDAISLDTDFFDALEFKATRVPEIKGFSVNKFMDLLKSIQRVNAKYFDIVEYCPEIDPGLVHAKILVQVIPFIIGVFIKSGYG